MACRANISKNMPAKPATFHNAPASSLESIANGSLLLELWPERGAPLLFYPGTMIEPGHYRLFLNKLWEAGFSVCAPHLPGHGQNRERLQTFGQLVELGELALAWLQKKCKGPVCLCGHSQGGILAMAHASHNSKVAACFAISSAFPELESAIKITLFGALAPWRQQILHALGSLAKLLPWLPVPLPLYLSGRRILAGRKMPVLLGSGVSRASYPLKFLYSLFGAQIQTPLQTPFWLFSAKNDALFPPKLIKESFDMASPPKGGIIWLENGGHMNIFNSGLAEFVARSCASLAASLGLSLRCGDI